MTRPTRATLALEMALGMVLRHAVAFGATPELLVRVGDDSPLGGRPFSTLSDPAIDDQGRIGFVGTSAGLFRRTGESIDGLLVAGDPVTGGRTVAALGTPELAEPGCVAFVAAFVGGNRGVMRLCDGAPQVVLATGDPGLGGAAIVSFGPAVASGPGGELAVVVSLSDGNTALVRRKGTTLVEVARTGTPVPTGGTFIGFRPVGVAVNGDVGFSATVRLGQGGLFLWRAASQQIAQVAVENSPSPGNGSFTKIGSATMNAGAQFAFRATTSRGGGGVFRVDAATLGAPIAVLATEGDRAPVVEENGDRTATFRGFPTSLSPSINATGQVAFRALLSDSQFNAGVFVVGTDGVVQRSVLAGQKSAILLSRLRDPELSDDGSLLLPAAEPGAGSGLYIVRGDAAARWLPTAALTSVGTGYRFVSGRGRDRAEDAVAFGQREGVFLATPAGVSKVALLDEPTPLRGKFSGFDALSGGPSGIAFHSTIDAGRSSEAIFSSDGLRVRTVARTERRVPGGKVVSLLSGVIEAVVSLQVEPAGVAFQALLQRGKGSSGLFVAGRGGVRKIAIAGQRADRGKLTAFGSFDLLTPSLAAFTATRTGAASPAVFLRAGKRLRAVAANAEPTGTRVAGTFTGFDGVDAGPAGIAFRATFGDPVGEGIFFADQKTVGAAVASQDVAPGGGRFVDIGFPAVTSAGVLFVGAVLEGASQGGLYRVPFAAVPKVDETLSVTPELLIGTPLSGGTILRIGQPRTNRLGAAVVPIELNGGGTTQGLFRLPPGDS